MKQYVYQFSLRKPNDEKKQFIIENDMIFTDDELTETKAKEISEKYKCDVLIQPIGYLITSKEKKEPLHVEYYNKQDIENYLNEWRKPEKVEEVHETN